MKNRGYRLYARPSFIEGIARLLDFGGTLNEYNYAADPEEADNRALWSDWEAVGEDFHTAMKKFPLEQVTR